MKRNKEQRDHKEKLMERFWFETWGELNLEEKEKILLAATALYKSKTRREDDVFIAWKKRGDRHIYSDKFHPLIDYFRDLERKELRQRGISRAEFTKPWKTIIIAIAISLVFWAIIIWAFHWAFQKIFF